MDDAALQAELLTLFEKHGVSVAVGRKPGGGVVIRSQDPRVDATNISAVYSQYDNRVYDRANPSRNGTVLRHDITQWTALVDWDDADEAEWKDIDHLGA